MAIKNLGRVVGFSAYETWLQQGNVGTEEDFLNSLKGKEGVDGKSAYEIWLEQGNIGTEEDFLNSLKNGSTGGGLTTEQIAALNNMFKIASYVENPLVTYKNFKEVFNIQNMDYSIVRNLTNCKSSSSTVLITEYESHAELITANDEYTLDNALVTITMNGVDITDTVYQNGAIEIPEVTGDIVITVDAVEQSILYRLTNTVFDGTKYIDTGLTPWAEDTDWSIVVDLEHFADNTDGIFRIFGAINTTSPWHGISLQRLSATDNYLMLQYMNEKAVFSGLGYEGYAGDFTSKQTNTSFNMKLVLNHKKGSSKMTYSVITDSDASSLISEALVTYQNFFVTEQLAIAKTGSKYWKGIINEFTLRNRTLLETEINEFLGCEV